MAAVRPATMAQKYIHCNKNNTTVIWKVQHVLYRDIYNVKLRYVRNESGYLILKQTYRTF